jgi:LPS-assembly protein
VLDQSLNRRSIEAGVELLAPTLSRVFDKPIFDHKIKHTIEPRVYYRRVNGVSGFQNIIRFDERDILSDTNEIEYSLLQRVFTKKVNKDCAQKSEDATAKPCNNQARELFSWEVLQRYYFDPTFGGAVVNGQRNVLTATEDLTGIAFLYGARRFSPIISKIRAHATANVDGSWQLDYDTVRGGINGSTVFANYRRGDYFFGGGHAFMFVPPTIPSPGNPAGPDKFNQFRGVVGYGGPSKLGLSSAAAIGFDIHLQFLQYGSFQTSYNWDCCGINIEYRRYALGSIRNENQFRFAFTLANIGNFGNLRRQETLY